MMIAFRMLYQKVRRAWETLRGYYAGLVLLRDPSRLDMVFVLDKAMPTEDRDALLARLRAAPSTRDALAERPRLDSIDVEALAKLPQGTFGRAFADFLRENGLDPRSIPRLDSDDEGTYIDAHLYETHDLWHVATGFESDIAGELGLQAFYAAQLGGRLPTLLLGGGLLQSAFSDPTDFGRRMEALARGWELGRRARPFFGVRWDRLWEKPLDAVRSELTCA